MTRSSQPLTNAPVFFTACASRDLCPVTKQACDCSTEAGCALLLPVPPPEGCEARRLPVAS